MSEKTYRFGHSAQVGTRRRVRLPTVVDTDIGARLYGDMCTIAHRVLGAAGTCSRGWLRPFSFPPKFRLRSVALTLLG